MNRTRWTLLGGAASADLAGAMAAAPTAAPASETISYSYDATSGLSRPSVVRVCGDVSQPN